MPPTQFIGLDREYDVRLLGALPSALNLFPSAALSAQFAAMAKQKRALCFTLIVPTSGLDKAQDTKRSELSAPRITPATAAVLVCLHVAPTLAARGPAPLVAMLEHAARHSLKPIHQFSAPLHRGGRPDESLFYREAVYAGEENLFIAITTHSPVDMPPETAQVVAQATKGCPFDIVTTVAITGERPEAVAPTLRAQPTIH